MQTATAEVKLTPFTRQELDVLFVALNPPQQSNANGHYFSGDKSAFFKLLEVSGLITQPVPKAFADEIVFGSTKINYRKSSFGIIDLVHNMVETNSARVQPTAAHVRHLMERIQALNPRFVCVIHSKVREALRTHANLWLEYGWCGKILPGSSAEFVLNYFPNGNNIPDAEKIRIFHLLKYRLSLN